MTTVVFKEGFESEAWTHKVRVFPVGGEPYDTEVGNIFVPPDWTFWFKHSDELGQPEASNIWRSQAEERIHSGDGAYKYFSFYRRMHAGLMHKIEVEPGKKYQVSGFAHAWSNGLVEEDGGHLDDPYWSDGAGRLKVAWFADPDLPLPYNTGDPKTDAKPNFEFVVGIDPYGGNDPFSDNVIWGNGYHIYNGYFRLNTPFVAAQGDTITIFLSTKTLWPFKHNDAYWDDIEVVESEDEPETGYKSTMLVLPQNATLEALAEVMVDGYPQRRTIGFSHDDAIALGGTAVLYDIPEDERAAYLAWYAERNPAVVVKWAETTASEIPDWSQYLLLQRDYNSNFGENNDCPIATKGCYITNLAMAQRIYGINPDATPVTVNEELGPASYAGCKPGWVAIEEKCGLHITDKGNLAGHLARGGVAMLEVDFDSKPDNGEQQHFVLAVGNADHVLDPWYGEESFSEMYNSIVSFRLLTDVSGSGTEEPGTGVGGVSLHLQTMVPGWENFVAKVRPRLVKVTASLQDVLGVLAVSPETVVVYRHVTNDYGDTLENSDPNVGARNWIAKFKDSLIEVANSVAPGCEIVVESVNECIPSKNKEAVQRLVNFDIAFIEELGKLGLTNVKAGVLNAAVGNPHETEFELLVPLARACANAGGYMDYHSYWKGFPGESKLVSDYQWDSGRWTKMDEVFVSHGIYVKWYGGESGVYATSVDGWLSEKCYNGSWNRYFGDIKTLVRMERDWNRTHGDRKYESVLFTSGVNTNWDDFQIRAAQMDDIGNYLQGA